ncbi:hypothetical protein KIN20_029113 [Parelaphostrongylus tenuis]|uniref:Uncharacterized protein n=1 Tax=Parelaphostrongylus tenuis TaxID=148309 RepID=A0AAD5QWA6_PARTN|nr:hypothetical protein KIN20_004648 [Parelaphostrongylus tenuis]KAJ1364750.1 hypothetical protein KIN20_024904 [Parelaphostrongylus tenuis]KAJ1364758.1 hypothetical protein KIN20_024913 [Parelaphostrongylus tenuis]KAJ1368057.1 hypothetical protein KIN20_029113 [Parelaphostrongylus tenuis]
MNGFVALLILVASNQALKRKFVNATLLCFTSILLFKYVLNSRALINTKRSNKIRSTQFVRAMTSAA